MLPQSHRLPKQQHCSKIINTKSTGQREKGKNKQIY